MPTMFGIIKDSYEKSQIGKRVNELTAIGKLACSTAKALTISLNETDRDWVYGTTVFETFLDYSYQKPELIETFKQSCKQNVPLINDGTCLIDFAFAKTAITPLRNSKNFVWSVDIYVVKNVPSEQKE